MKISSFLKLFGAIILGILISIGVSIGFLRSAFVELEQSSQNQIEFRELGQQVQDASNYLTQEVRAYTQFGDRRHFDNYWTEVNETKRRERALERIVELGASESELAMVDEAVRESDSLISLEERAMGAVENGNLELARQLVFGQEYESSKSTIEGHLSSFSDALNERAANEVVSAENLTMRIMLIVIGLIVALAVIVIWLFLFISKKVHELDSLGAILGELEQSGGDLTARVNLSGNDEIVAISKSFDKTLESLQDIMISVRDEANTVGTAVDVIASRMAVLNKSVESVSSTTEEMSAGMEETAASAEQMNATSTQIEAAVESIAVKAQEGSVSAGEIRERADGLKATATTSQSRAVSIYESSSKGLLEAIEQSKEVEKISDLSNAIMDITEQTNLLALNSAIEAARAGEAGKGFAVVAGEIKKLADESKDTAEEIQHITGSVVRSVENLATSSKSILDFINENVIPDYEMLVETGNKYSDDAEMVDDLVTELSATSQELLSSINSMIRAISEVTHATDESASGITDIASSSSDMLEMSYEISEKVRSSRESAEKLLARIERFKL